MYAAYFFLPLPEPLLLPDHLTIPFMDQSALSDDLYIPRLSEDGLMQRLIGSILLRQVDAEAEVRGQRESLQAAFSAFPQLAESANRAKDIDRLTVASVVTVAEVMVLTEGTSDEHLAEALDSALDLVRSLQSSYFAAARQPVQLVSQASLPPFVPCATRYIDLDETKPSWPDSLSFVVTGDQGFSTHDTQTSHSKNLFAELEDSRIRGGPFDSCLHLQREALLAIRQGNTVTSSILLGASCELFLRDLNLLLLWEEGITPEEAATAVPRNQQVSQIAKKSFHNRLGGTWDPNVEGPIQGWSVHVRGLRDRVLHSGYDPTPGDIENAQAATESLLKYVGDLLASKFDRFPIATYLVHGSVQMKARGLWHKWESLRARDFVPSRINERFRIYRQEFLRTRSEPDRQGVAERSDLVLVKYRNEETRWWLVDRISGLACLAQPPVDPPQESLDLVFGDPQAEGHEISIQVLSESDRQPLLGRVDWVSASDAIPPLGSMRWPASRVPPPVANRID